MSSLSVLRGLLFHNLTLKLSSLVLATILWLHATTLHTYDEELAVKLDVTGVPDSMVIVSPLPDKARVSFRAKGDQLWWLTLRKPHIGVSVEGLGPGSVTIPLYPDHVRLPGALDVQVTSILTPRTLNVELDMLTRKTVPVIVPTEGLPSPGFVRVTDRIEVDPAHVALEGPSGVLEELDAVYSEPLDVTGAKGPVSRRLRLVLADRSLLTASADAVTALVQFERLIHHTMDVEPIPSRALPDGWRLSPADVRVHLWGPASLEDSLRALDPTALQITVTVPRSPRDSTVLDVGVRPPAWVRQCTIEPQRVVLRRIRPGS